MAASVDLNGLVLRSNGRKSSAPDFPLRAEYFIPAKMPLNVIFPRPNIEAQAHAAHRWAHSQMLHEIPIGVQGGAWPFKYELIYDETGLGNIGGFYGEENYGVLSFNSSTLNQSQEYAYTVRVTGQDGVYVDVSRTYTPDNTKFVFVQKGYAGTKVGTITQPLEDIPDWYKNSNTDATYANKIIVFRTGTYNATGNSAANPANIVLSTPYKTPSLIAFPNEVVEWDMTNAKIYDNSGIDDIFIAGIKFKNARNDVANAQYFWLANESNRCTWFRCKFTDMGYGIDGGDNNGPLFGGGTVNNKSYYYIVDCLFENINNNGTNGGFHDFYMTDHIVVERNTVRNCNSAYGFWLKTSRSFISVRGNICLEGNQGGMITLAMGSGTGGGAPHDIEICYNAISVPTAQDQDCLTICNDTDWQNQWYNIYLYRNLIFGGYCRVPGFAGLEPVHTDANIVATSNIGRWDTTKQTTAVSNYVSSVAASISNPDGTLKSGTGFATHGHRIYA